MGEGRLTRRKTYLSLSSSNVQVAPSARGNIQSRDRDRERDLRSLSLSRACLRILRGFLSPQYGSDTDPDCLEAEVGAQGQGVKEPLAGGAERERKVDR